MKTFLKWVPHLLLGVGIGYLIFGPAESDSTVFQEMCQERKRLTQDQAHTVHVLLEISETVDCSEASHRLQALTDLNLGGRDLRDLSPLQGLTQIESLNLMMNEIESLEALSSLVNLKRLYASENEISSLRGLEKLPLQVLAISDNKLQKVSEINLLPQLRFLDLANNEIKDIHITSSLINLQEIDLNGNQLSAADIDLSGASGLKTLKLNSNRLGSLTFLKNLREILEIQVANNQLQSISDGLPASLQALNISNNQIVSIEPLHQLTRLKIVVAENNMIERIDDQDFWRSKAIFFTGKSHVQGAM